MKKRLRQVAFVLLVGTVTLLAFVAPRFFGIKVTILITYEKNVPAWHTTVRSHFIQQVQTLTQEDLGRVYADQKLDGEAAQKPHTIVTIQQWLIHYATNDMEPFITTVINGLPQDYQKDTWSRATASNLPKIALKYASHEAGSTNTHDTIWLNPALIDSYDNLRGTISHELVHYWVQGVSLGQFEEIGEGVTEYLTIKAFEQLTWDLKFLHRAEEELDEQSESEDRSENAHSLLRSIDVMQKQSLCYPIQTSDASILMSLDSKNILLSWYVGKEEASFHPYHFVAQLLEQYKISQEDGQSWIGVLKNLEELRAKMLETLKESTQARRQVIELFDRQGTLLDEIQTSQFISVHMKKHFDEIIPVLEKGEYKPLPQDAWDATLIHADQQIHDGLEGMKPKRKQEFMFYRDQLLGLLKIAMYEDLLSIHASSDDTLRKIFFGHLEEDASRNEVIRSITKRIDLVIGTELQQARYWILSQEYAEKKKEIDDLKEEAKNQDEKADRMSEETVALFQTVSQHHVKIVYLLRDSGVDVLSLFKQRGMPQYFLQQVTDGLCEKGE